VVALNNPGLDNKNGAQLSAIFVWSNIAEMLKDLLQISLLS
jgi:hypothetical protein